MREYKCPKCKTILDKEATFCKSCGSPVSFKREYKIKVKEESSLKVENNENEPKKPKINKIYLILIAIILILSLMLSFSLFYITKHRNKKCIETPIIVEKEPTVQYINYKGYRFSIPLDWKFAPNSENYTFIDKAEEIFVEISYDDTLNYKAFLEDEYQKHYLETLKSDENIFINSRVTKTKNNIDYYLMEGTYDSYDYIIVVTSSDSGIFLTKAEFKNNTSYMNRKEEVIDFAISSLKI